MGAWTWVGDELVNMGGRATGDVVGPRLEALLVEMGVPSLGM